MSRGAIIYAHNNKEIDYVKIAYINSLMIKENLNIGVTLVTDEGTYTWAKECIGSKKLENKFDEILIHDRDYDFNRGNIRLFKDTAHHSKKLSFYNANRYTAFELSPYEETLLIDADYLVLSNSLQNCWGTNNDVMINRDTQEAYFSRSSMLSYVDAMSISLYWATVVYFKKSTVAEQLFKIVEHISKNYEYYRALYSIPERLFRNDYAFSIAIHMMNGFSNLEIAGISSLPNPKLLKVYDFDDIHSVPSANEIICYLENPKEGGTYILNSIRDIDVHIMNKWAILRHYDTFKEMYNG